MLVLDEATSSLDPGTEALVEAAMDRLMEGRTVIVIAHRLSTAERADRVAVVADGRLVEVGTHDELLAAGGALRRACYADLDGRSGLVDLKVASWSAGDEQRQDLLGRAGVGEQVALRRLAAERRRRSSCRRLDALGDGCDLQAVGQADHGGGDGASPRGRGRGRR